jgi:hypothetical protein
VLGRSCGDGLGNKDGLWASLAACGRPPATQ